MMKKYIYIICCIIGMVSWSCSDDFLDVASPSNVDQDFVFFTPDEAYKVLVGCYDIWRGAYGGLFYDLNMVGSDSETHPEGYDAQTRHIPEGLYASEISIDYSNGVGAWENLYREIGRALGRERG